MTVRNGPGSGTWAVFAEQQTDRAEKAEARVAVLEAALREVQGRLAIRSDRRHREELDTIAAALAGQSDERTFINPVTREGQITPRQLERLRNGESVILDDGTRLSMPTRQTDGEKR